MVKSGIVGLPNVGKSTLFNGITSTEGAKADNFPFCTIDPNIASIPVPDARLNKIATIAGSAKILNSTLELVDIAGLVKGANEGEGLGNQFLSNIREVDLIIHMVRCFENKDIIHVEGRVDPKQDIEIINTELMLSDLASLEKQLQNIERKIKKDKDLTAKYELIKKFIDTLSNFKMLHSIKEEIDPDLLKEFQLLTLKPMLYVLNVGESEVKSGNQYSKEAMEFLDSQGYPYVMISAAIEAEISLLPSGERGDFLKYLGLESSGLDQIISTAYSMLGLISFFTAGPQEARSWTITRNMLAPQAAGKIHGDFERGFIKAEVLSYDDFVSYNGWIEARKNGKARLEGKEYAVQDGDVMIFKHNV